MKTHAGLLAFTFGLLILGGVVTAGALEPARPCYTCNVGSGGDQGCMVCTLGSGGDNKSCIPYCNGTCSVGQTCHTAFRGLQLSPDGSIMAPEVYFAALMEAPGRVLRNCRGHVVSRPYGVMAAARLRTRAHSIVV
jgi:hypothetical protein